MGCESGSLYVDIATNDKVALNAMLRLAMAVAETKKLRPMVMATRYGTLQERRIIRSFAIPCVVSTFGTMIAGGLSNPVGIWRYFRRIRAGSTLAMLRIGLHPVGKHIYDHLLRRHGLPRLGVLSTGVRFEIAAELAYYFGVKRLLDRKQFSFAILSDNTYRQGITFEILKESRIPSLCAIDLNGMAAHLYRNRQDYDDHCRTPDAAIVRALDADPAVQAAARRSLDARISGREMQHDLIRAYSVAKRTPEAEELRREFGACDGKKLVLVMAHIFQDAPHAYPGTLFRDYSQWLVETCRRLANNPNVALVVKEHPSIELYGEEGTIDAVLSELGPGRIRIVKDLNTRSFFESADVVVTCGGTCGMEFPCFGVPVVVAARPPYSGFSYITHPATREEYYEALDVIHKIPRLSVEQIHLARTVFYVLQTVQKVDKNSLGLGTQGFSLGQVPDEDKAWGEMLHEMAEGNGYSRLLAYITAFFESGFLNLMECFHLTTPTHGDANANVSTWLLLAPGTQCK
jgi:hypothetical protein